MSFLTKLLSTSSSIFVNAFVVPVFYKTIYSAFSIMKNCASNISVNSLVF